MSRPESPEARAERILAELREQTREAAGVLKDMQKTIAQARATVEDYLHDECERALIENTRSVVDAARRVCAEHEAKVIQRVIDYAALIEANFSRDALVREAANYIEALVMQKVSDHDRKHARPSGEIIVDLCTRPHAD